ncbi:hypothetical protein [Nocardia mexicana]|uniref:Uncharacterized protein n=1 Tax=Nocardia mexicana TaxID=279262 RepID=A0A370H295_9NOCA|nr:hypothetical protein [Nocardia mexicana]RDI48193.1 hypothetical protein DFR68_10821 [Nocardia mexicana]
MARDHWETPEQRAIRRKNRLRFAIVAPLAILLVAWAVVAYLRSPESEDAAAPIAPAFQGEWQGVADNGRGSFDVVLRIGSENPEDAVTSSYTDKASGARCDRAERVVRSTESELTLAARSTNGAGCDGDAESTVQLHTDGSLAYRVGAPDGALTGTLRKV